MKDYFQEIAKINENIIIREMRDRDVHESWLHNKRSRDIMERNMLTEIKNILCYINDGRYHIELPADIGDKDGYYININDANVEILPHDFTEFTKHGMKPHINIVQIYNNMDEVIKQIEKQVES